MRSTAGSTRCRRPSPRPPARRRSSRRRSRPPASPRTAPPDGSSRRHCGGVQSTISGDARDHGRHDGHADRGGIDGAPAGHVAADGPERPHDLAEPDAVALVPPLGRDLARVQVAQPLDQLVERPLQVVGRLGSAAANSSSATSTPVPERSASSNVAQARPGPRRPRRRRVAGSADGLGTVGSISSLMASSRPPRSRRSRSSSTQDPSVASAR